MCLHKFKKYPKHSNYLYSAEIAEFQHKKNIME